MINLWPHQEDAHTQIIKAFKNNLKPLLVMPTGAGKSITVASFVSKFKKFYKFVLIVRTRGLVFQLEDDLKLFDLDYSILMAGEEVNLDKNIILCSKDTINSRNLLPFEGQENVVCLYDEADETPEFQKELIKRYSVARRFFYLGQTATPYNGLDHFDTALVPITARELNKQGILVNYIYYIPKQIDFSDVELVNGEWKKSDILKKLDTNKAIASAFSSWQQYCENRQTLIFSVNKEHSKRTVNYINQYYGKEVAIHCDADTPKDKRTEAINKFKQGKIIFLSNVRLFTRGTNIIEIGAIWDQASTLSINLHIQKLGRGSRKNPFYKDCIVLDIANNLLNNGHFYQDRKINLKAEKPRTKNQLEVLPMRVCSKCIRASETHEFGPNNICPICGFKNSPIKKKKLSKYMENKIFMQSASEEQIEQRKMINEFKKILWKKKNIGKKYPNDIAREKACHDLIKKYGMEKVMKIQKSIGLNKKIIANYKEPRKYKPLGGLL